MWCWSSRGFGNIVQLRTQLTKVLPFLSVKTVLGVQKLLCFLCANEIWKQRRSSNFASFSFSSFQKWSWGCHYFWHWLIFFVFFLTEWVFWPCKSPLKKLQILKQDCWGELEWMVEWWIGFDLMKHCLHQCTLWTLNPRILYYNPLDKFASWSSKFFADLSLTDGLVRGVT